MFDLTTLSFETLLPFILVGFAAQIVDGALGMAFGVISNTLLLWVGVPPAAASAGVHTVETFTTAVSGISHVLHKNVNWRLFLRLMIPGVIGGVLGAYVLSNIDASTAKPFILAYLTSIGVYLLYRGLRFPPKQKEPKIVEPLGLIGGFLDAAGGGGWGPVVTSNLLVQGASPRTTIGTVNAAEFFIALASGLSFTLLGGLTHWTTIAGLVVGGLFAAPIAALLVRVIPARVLMVVVGLLIASLSLVSLAELFG